MLDDRKVLVARAPDRAQAWTAALASRGLVVVARETFTLESLVGQARARRAIERIDDWDWILVTSSNGLRFLVRGLQTRSLEVKGISARFGVVGPQTARALEELGRPPDVVADPPNAVGLAAVLEAEISAGDRLLIVRPEAPGEGLVERLEAFGAEVHAVPFYRNVPGRDVSVAARELLEGGFAAAVFGSPSSFLHLFSACADGARQAFERISLVAIGPTTAQAIRDHGCAVAAVASEPTPEGLARAVETALSR